MPKEPEPRITVTQTGDNTYVAMGDDLDLSSPFDQQGIRKELPPGKKFDLIQIDDNAVLIRPKPTSQ